LTAFDTAWDLLKMPFVSPDEIPEQAWRGIMGSVGERERRIRDDFWVNDKENPTAWGMHRDRDSEMGDGSHIGADIPFFEVKPGHKGKGVGREALMQFIQELKDSPKHPQMGQDSKVMGDRVIPSSKGFWERMYEDDVIHDYTEEY